MPFRHFRDRLDPSSPQPAALQLAALLAREILDGRLPSGTSLPGSRALAETLGLTRHAAMSALRELELEGWVESRPGSGTYVAAVLPCTVPRHWGELPPVPTVPERPAFDLPGPLAPITSLAVGMLDLAEGQPDPRLAPKEALAKAYQRALRRHGDDLLGRGETRGNATLREELARHLQTQRGLTVGPEHLLITRGTPMAHTLLAAAILPKGGHVAVEDPGQRDVWETLRAVADVTLHPVPVDGEGLDTDALATLASQVRLDAVLVTPQRQIPTTVRMSPARRSHLLALARTHGFALVEDDPDFELFGPEGPASSLASQDSEGRVIHLGSFAHTLAPGMSLGFLVAPSRLIDGLARVRQRLDMQGDRVLEWALADLLRDGDYARHLARSRQVYTQRLEHLMEALPVDLGPAFKVGRPPGGLAVWLETSPHLDVAHWAARATALGVRLKPGQHHAFDGRALPALRLGFGLCEAKEMRGALHTLRTALDTAHA